MSDLRIRIDGRAGRITLTRPKALNALSYEMCVAIDAALKAWQHDDAVALVLIDAEGEKAFCAGGDIAQMYATGLSGEYEYARQFWRDEYQMNARFAEYPKPVVSFLQGFVMGGGVGVGCHASHRIVGESSQIAMPECAIGLVPDVGGSGLLARAPGALGRYLGLTGARMGPGDAIYAGFADFFVPQSDWDALKQELAASGIIPAQWGAPPLAASLMENRDWIDMHFGQADLSAIMASIGSDMSDFATQTLKALVRNSPLAMACTFTMLRNLGTAPTIRNALRQEFRFTYRALEKSDFIEGIRAAIIDKDRSPRWQHDSIDLVTGAEVAALLAPLGNEELAFDTAEEEGR